MNKIRFFSLFMALLLCIATFTACKEDAPSPEDVLAEADAALLSAPYNARMDMNFICTDATLAPAFDAMDMEIGMRVKGKRFLIDMELSDDVRMSISFVEGTAYSSIYTFGQYTLRKTSLTDEQRDALLEQKGASMGITSGDFATISLQNKSDGVTEIVCDGLSEEAKEKLIEENLGDYREQGFQVSLKNVTMTVRIKNGKYDTLHLSCLYWIGFDEKTVALSVASNVEYDYGFVEDVEPPENPGSYKFTTPESLFGL